MFNLNIIINKPKKKKEEKTKKTSAKKTVSKASTTQTISKNDKPLNRDEFKKKYLTSIHELGGDFFEKFLANLLEKYFNETRRDVIESKINGGINDGGIDIIMKTEDELGFVETIMIQAKNRLSTKVTEKEMREFYGAVNAYKGTRGIFVTTSSFCSTAKKFIESLDNCVGIDGNKLFEIAKSISYGMHISKLGYKLDNMIFGLSNK